MTAQKTWRVALVPVVPQLRALPTIIIFALVARKLTSGLALGVGK